MDGKAVQLIQGREKALEEPAAQALARFQAFREIQIIDLDAAMGRGNNDDLVRDLARRSRARIGGGIRSLERARTLVEYGAHRIIVGTAAIGKSGVRHEWLASVASAAGRERLTIALDSRNGKIVTSGWKAATELRAEDVVAELEPYCSGFLCTYVDKEGMMQGTDLKWFEALRAKTPLEIVAAGGVTTLDDVRALAALRIHAAIGMAIYTGRLSLSDLLRMDQNG